MCIPTQGSGREGEAEAGQSWLVPAQEEQSTAGILSSAGIMTIHEQFQVLQKEGKTPSPSTAGIHPSLVPLQDPRKLVSGSIPGRRQ